MVAVVAVAVAVAVVGAVVAAVATVATATATVATPGVGDRICARREGNGQGESERESQGGHARGFDRAVG